MKKWIFVWFVIASVLFQYACEKNNNEPDPEPEENPDTPLYQSHTEWSYDLGIYEVNVRQYTQEGTFAAFETHLSRLKDMGVGILWLMPIHPIGEVNRLGTLGSYYSVKDYYGVNPEFGTLSDFKHLVNAVHDQGMFVIIDWVANHTSWDNELTVTDPQFYVQDEQGNFIAPPGTGWSDVIELDYSDAGLRNYMMTAMKYWMTETGIDGFRCDAVDMVPLDFWSEAIEFLKEENPGILMLAEGDKPGYHSAGFDMTYAWGLYGFNNGIFTSIYAGTKNAGDLANYLQNDFSRYPASAYRMCFTSNHDENSWNGTVFEQLGESAELFAVLSHTLNGMPLIYSGQEAGLNDRLQFFEKDPIQWQEHPFKDLYTTLLGLKKENKALWNGEAGARAVRINTDYNAAIYAFEREKEDNTIVGVFNLTGFEQTFTMDSENLEGSYTDVFGETAFSISASQELTLGEWGYILLEKDAE